MKVLSIPDRVFFKIGDVAEILSVKTYVIRFWETEFPFLAPEKSVSGQRVYRRSQIEALALVKHLLYEEKYSIEGAKKKLTELRKTGKLKEAKERVVHEGQMTEAGLRVEGTSLDDLKAKLAELRKLIRDPNQAGLEVPGLSVKSFSDEAPPTEPEVQDL